MSSVSKILEGHGKTPKDPKETDKLAERLQQEFQRDGTVPPAAAAKTPPTTPKPRGRPPKNKSPGPQANFNPQPPPPQANSPEEIANRMKCKRLIRKLRAYKRNFPDLLGSDLSEVNPHLCTYEQLTALIDSCKEVIGDEIESRCAPDILGSLLDQAEMAAMSMAMKAAPGSAAQKLIHLRNFANVAKQDPCIAMDLRLIACEWVGVIPQNPYLRLILNLARCAGEVMSANANSIVLDSNESENYEEF